MPSHYCHHAFKSASVNKGLYHSSSSTLDGVQNTEMLIWNKQSIERRRENPGPPDVSLGGGGASTGGGGMINESTTMYIPWSYRSCRSVTGVTTRGLPGLPDNCVNCLGTIFGKSVPVSSFSCSSERLCGPSSLFHIEKFDKDRFELCEM
jgi:hypothetical protein